MRSAKSNPVSTAPAIIIDPNAVFTRTQLQALLGLASSSLRREVRLGRLRVSRRTGKYFFLGSWILAWLEGGELKRPDRIKHEVNGVH